MMAFFAFSQAAEAQRHIHSSYTKASGLPSDYVFHIGQSPDGHMWFGTERGAARYDGNRFRVFTTNDGLPHNFVYTILTDSRGRTWFGTAADFPSYLQYDQIRTLPIDWGGVGGIYDITTVQDSVMVFRFSNGLGLLVGDRYRFHPIVLNTVKESRLNLDTDGSLVVADGRNVLRLAISPDLAMRVDTLIRFESGSLFMSSVLAPDGTIYTHTLNHLYRHRIGRYAAEIIEHHSIPIAAWMTVRPTRDGHDLIVGSRQIGLQTLRNGVVTPLLTDQSKDRGHITALHLDYEGNLWAAFLGEGVEKISNWNTLRLNMQTGLTENNVWRIGLHGNTLYLLSKTGVDLVDAVSLRPLGRIPLRTSIRGLDRQGDTLIIATMNDLRAYLDVPGRRPANLLFSTDVGEGVNDIVTGADGSIWVATAGQVLHRRFKDGTMQRFKVKNGVERLSRLGDDIWWLTSDDGIHRYRNDQIRTFSLKTGDLPSDDVTSIGMAGSSLLIGTSKGLVRLDSTDRTTVVSATDGLIGSAVKAIFTRDGKSAWVATSDQLHLVDTRGIRPISTLGTIQSELSSAHWHAYHGQTGRWFISTPNGVLVVDLDSPTRSIPPPKVAISGFTLNNIPYRHWQADSIRIRSAATTLELTFNGLTFISEAHTRYTFKLDGLDAYWSAPQQSNTVRYANLRPGTYVFRVKALNVDNVPTSDEATLRITILTPLWMHPVTLSLAAALLVVGLVAFAQYRVAAFKRELVRRNEQRQFEAIQRVGASISHDIRNTVFSLNLLAKNLEKRFDNPDFRKDAIETIESSLQYLTKLVDQLQRKPGHHTIRLTEVDLKAVAEDVIRRQRSLTPEIQVECLVEPGTRIRSDIDLLTRILENLVRNAAEALGGVGVVRISGLVTAAHCLVCISDNGPGIEEDFIRNRLFRPFQSTKTKGLGIGLYTCQELAKAMGGRIDVTSKPGKGTTFCLHLPKST